MSSTTTCYIKDCYIAQDNHNAYFTVNKPRNLVLTDDGKMYQVDLLNDLRASLSKGDKIRVMLMHDIREKKLFSEGLVLVKEQADLNLNSYFASLADYITKDNDLCSRLFKSKPTFAGAVNYLKERFEITYGRLKTLKDGKEWITYMQKDQERRLLKACNDHYVLKRFANEMPSGQADLIDIDDIFNEEGLRLPHTPLRSYFLDRLARNYLLKPIEVLCYHLLVNKFNMLYEPGNEISKQKIMDKLIKRYNILDVTDAFKRFLTKPELFLYLSNDGVKTLRDLQQLPGLSEEAWLTRIQALIIRSERRKRTRCVLESFLDPRVLQSETCQEMLKEYDISPETIEGSIYYSFNKVQLYEKRVVQDLMIRQAWHKNLVESYCAQIAKVVEGRFIKEIVDEDQLATLNRIITLPYSVVLGPGGCGKTTLTKYILAAAILRKDPILCVSFTGKAVQRIREVILDLLSNPTIKAMILKNFPDLTGQIDTTSKAKDFLKALKEEGFLRVSTIHSFVASSKRSGYQIVILDEISMVNTSLYAKLLPHLSAECKVIMLGDSYQLPPVKNYSILGELLRSSLDDKRVGFFYLSKIYRSSGTVCDFLSLLRSSWNPSIRVDEEALACLPWSQNSIEGITLDYNDNYKASMGLEYIVSAYCNYISRGLSVKVLCYTNAVVDALNVIIQETVNPKGNQYVAKRKKWSKAEGAYKLEDVIYRVGDPVICTKNSSSNDLYNGQEGVIQSIDLAGMEATVVFYGSPGSESNEEHVVRFYLPSGTPMEDDGGIEDDSEHLDRILPITILRVSYALTTHKCQGSQYDAVIYYLTDIDNRNLFYTGTSRTMRHLFIYINCPGGKVWEKLLKVVMNRRLKPIKQFIAERIGLRTIPPEEATTSNIPSPTAETTTNTSLPPTNDCDGPRDLLDQLLDQYLEYG